ncbi:hypothetical protein [uncultured Ferrimonas sp.]|uniref:hypothetical protein n=1 Tax=uncultured Ferrimonas sp. TaxID=432640 RepID=UPI002616E653|nr:hypothetical protein [uncultured Ferrimonas sp.]
MGTIFQDPLTLGFSTIIVVFALVSGMLLKMKTGHLVRSLQSVNDELNQFKTKVEYDDNGDAMELEWQPNAASIAFQNYTTMKSVITEVDCLKPSWKSYERSMQLPDVDYSRKPEQAPALRNTLQVSSVFNMESIVEPVINLRQYTAIPNTLTGAGLLFTFVGLMIGIGEASIGLSSSDIDAAKQSLNPLLSGASIAFTTSVVGIICSMIFSWFEKDRFHQLEKAVKEFSDYLSSHIEFMDSDKLASLQLEATEAQTKALSDFQLDQQRITDETISRVSKEFRETLLQSAGKEIDQIGDVLAQMSESLKVNVESLTQAQERTLSATSTLSVNIEKSVTGLVEKLNVAVAEMAEREQKIIVNVDSTVQSMIKVLQRQMSDMAASYGSTMGQISAEFEQIPEKISGVADQNMQESLRRYQALTDEMLPPMLEQVSSSLSEQVSKLTEEIKGAESAVADSLATLPSVLTGFDQMNSEVRDSVSAFKELNQLSNGNLENLSNTLLHLDQTSADFVYANKQNDETMRLFQELVEKMRSTADSTNESNRSIASATEQLRTAIDSQAGLSGQLESSIVGAFKQLNHGLEQYVAHANDRLVDMDGKAAHVANNLIDATNEIGDLVNDLSRNELRKATEA